jgi:hypothetical protein
MIPRVRLLDVTLPHSAALQNIRTLIQSNAFFASSADGFRLVFPTSGLHLQPPAIAMLGAWGAWCAATGRPVACVNANMTRLRYLVRMRLFDHLPTPPPGSVQEFESAGRFIPLTRLSSSEAVAGFIADVVPLLHSPGHADAVTYCLSELTRNVIEHAGGADAFACAQYYPTANKVVIGVADAGIGIRTSLSRAINVNTDAQAIIEALKPGVSGATSRLYGTSDNAGAGLFFTRAIAQASGGYFAVYSGTAAFRLRKHPANARRVSHDPTSTRHDVFTGLPGWSGTAIGIEVAKSFDRDFDELMAQIRSAYLKTAMKRPHPRIRFAP